MIDEFLTETKKEPHKRSNTFSAIRSIEGEKVAEVRFLDEGLYLVKFESGNSLLIKSDASFEILAREETEQSIREVAETLPAIREEVERLRNILMTNHRIKEKDGAKPENEAERKR